MGGYACPVCRNIPHRYDYSFLSALGLDKENVLSVLYKNIM